MSTRIYQGRRIAQPFNSVYRELLRLKPEAKRIGTRNQHKWLVTRATELIDDAAIKGEPAPQGALGSAWIEMMDRQREIKRSGYRDPAVDFQFELYLFPNGRSTLLLANTECQELREWFDSLPFVEDYSFWNSTDRPDDVSAAAWRARERAWDRVMPSGVPADTCLSFAMYSDGYVDTPSDAELPQFIMAIEDRLKRIVRNSHVDEVLRRLVDEEKAIDPEFNLANRLSLVSKAARIANEEHERRGDIERELGTKIKALSAADFRNRS